MEKRLAGEWTKAHDRLLAALLERDPAETIFERRPASLVELFFRSWTGSSVSHQSLLLQLGARDEFGLADTRWALSRWNLGSWRKARRLYKEHGSLVRRIIRAMYDYTQEKLAEAGIDEVVLWRGVRGHGGPKAVRRLKHWEGGMVYYEFRPLNSWTTDFEVAQGFAGRNGLLLGIRVPRNEIVGTWWTGLTGLEREKEMVLMGGRRLVRVARGAENEREFLQATQEQLKEAPRPRLLTDEVWVETDEEADWLRILRRQKGWTE